MYPSFLSGGAVRTETTNYNVTKDDWLILCDATAGGFTVTLPDPSGLSGKHLVTYLIAVLVKLKQPKMVKMLNLLNVLRYQLIKITLPVYKQKVL